MKWAKIFYNMLRIFLFIWALSILAMVSNKILLDYGGIGLWLWIGALAAVASSALRHIIYGGES